MSVETGVALRRTRGGKLVAFAYRKDGDEFLAGDVRDAVESERIVFDREVKAGHDPLEVLFTPARPAAPNPVAAESLERPALMATRECYLALLGIDPQRLDDRQATMRRAALEEATPMLTQAGLI